jgi:hypothetical protein
MNPKPIRALSCDVVAVRPRGGFYKKLPVAVFDPISTQLESAA